MPQGLSPIGISIAPPTVRPLNSKVIYKKRRGKEKIITFLPDIMTAAQLDIEQYKALWESRLDALNKMLKEKK